MNICLVSFSSPESEKTKSADVFLLSASIKAEGHELILVLLPLASEIDFIKTTFLSTLRLCKIVMYNRCQIIHFYGMFLGQILGLFIKCLTRSIIIQTIVGYDCQVAKRRFIGVPFRWSLRKVDGVVAVSESLRNELLEMGVHPSKIFIIPGGVPIDLFSSADGSVVRRKYSGKKKNLILSVSRLDKLKGIEHLVHASYIIKNWGISFKLLIVGDGPERERLEKMVIKEQLEDCVKFIGNVPHEEVAKFLAAADVFAFPSLSEGLPKSLVEATASGKPIVSTTIPGIVEFIEHTRNAILVPPNNSKQLAEAMRLVLEDEKLRKRLSIGSRERKEILKIHDVDAVAKEYLSFYKRKLLEKAKRKYFRE